MMARWLCLFAVAMLLHTGCACYGTPPACKSCGPFDAACGDACGGPSDPCGVSTCTTCCIRIPKPIVWCGNENECGPECDSCACPTECGILPMLRRGLTCGKGCGEVYWGEWISDPPDCCDPCDQCHGVWMGPHGYCNPGPSQRLLAAIHGHKYCPSPCCGGAGCGLCNKPACNDCGGGGCASCGGGHDGVIMGEHHDMHAPHSLMEENWEVHPSTPVPGKPVHKAQGTPRVRVSQAPRQSAPMQPTNSRMVRQAGYAGR